jgi:hypothetical protein
VAAKIWTGIRSRAEHLRRLSVVFAVELRLKIVTELYMREMSPKQFFEAPFPHFSTAISPPPAKAESRA